MERRNVSARMKGGRAALRGLTTNAPQKESFNSRLDVVEQQRADGSCTEGVDARRTRGQEVVVKETKREGGRWGEGKIWVKLGAGIGGVQNLDRLRTFRCLDGRGGAQETDGASRAAQGWWQDRRLA